MADNAPPPAKLELRLPGSMLEELTSAAALRGEDVGALALDWIQDRLVHEREKQQGLAKRVRHH